MLLNEFFSRPIDIAQNQKSKNDVTATWMDDLFYFILDHDKLHKDYFFPVARKLSNLQEAQEQSIIELFMPMVVKGCKEFYHKQKMEGRMDKKFPRDLREELCKRLYDHYYEDVRAGKYRLG